MIVFTTAHGVNSFMLGLASVLLLVNITWTKASVLDTRRGWKCEADLWHADRGEKETACPWKAAVLCISCECGCHAKQRNERENRQVNDTAAENSTICHPLALITHTRSPAPTRAHMRRCLWCVMHYECSLMGEIWTYIWIIRVRMCDVEWEYTNVG